MIANGMHEDRVLAIDPCHRGVGFVLLDKGLQLADWGVCRGPNDRTATSVESVVALMERYQPSKLVVETTRKRETRRGTRATLLIRELSREAKKRNIVVRPVGMASVGRYFKKWRATKKEARANTLVKRFPALALYRPPCRRPWTSEDSRMAIFDALSFALAEQSGENAETSRTQ